LDTDGAERANGLAHAAQRSCYVTPARPPPGRDGACRVADLAGELASEVGPLRRPVSPTVPLESGATVGHLSPVHWLWSVTAVPQSPPNW